MSARAADCPGARRPPGAPCGTFGRFLGVVAVLVLASLVALVSALGSGSVPVPTGDVARALLGGDSSPYADVIREIRLPRVIAAFATGGLLALAGALMQVLFRNPLADPYVLGLSGGAAVGALGAMLLGLGATFTNVGAFGGAILTACLVVFLARRHLGASSRGSDASPRLLLTGVMVSAVWSACVAVILIVAPDSALRGMLFWMMGDLGSCESWHAAAIGLPVLVALAWPGARDLNAMLRGEEIAQSLGVEVRRARAAVLALASMATAIAVTTAGSIGFVGLVVPHALRLVMGNDQRLLLPASALAGGALLVTADTIARTAFAPHQLPVGVVTAFLGAPAFIALLARRGAP
jgi:iron complex transport system permease protein